MLCLQYHLTSSGAGCIIPITWVGGTYHKYMHNHGHTCTPDKSRALKLAKQAQGTLAKVIKMIEDDVYCPEIIQQADSTAGLLRTMRKELLAGHLDSCAFERLKENKREAIDELMKIYNLNS